MASPVTGRELSALWHTRQSSSSSPALEPSVPVASPAGDTDNSLPSSPVSAVLADLPSDRVEAASLRDLDVLGTNAALNDAANNVPAAAESQGQESSTWREHSDSLASSSLLPDPTASSTTDAHSLADPARLEQSTDSSFIATPGSSYPPSLHSRSSAPRFPSFPRRVVSGSAVGVSSLSRSSTIAPAAVHAVHGGIPPSAPDSDIVFTRSDHLPDYGEVPSKPPSYLAVQERDARNSFDGHLMHDFVPNYVTLGLFGGCVPSIGPLRVGTLRFVTMVYLACTVVITLSFTILEIMMMRDFTQIFRIPANSTQPEPDPRLEPDVDPLPLVHLVLNAIWCPSALMAFVLLSQEVVMGYRIAVNIVYFCLFGEVFTTVLQSANRATQVSRGANNQPNDHAQRLLYWSISIRTALLPLHLIGVWMVYWTAKLLPNSMETAAMVARRRRIRAGQRVPGWHPELMDDEDVSVATVRANGATADARSVEATSSGPWHWPV